MAVRYACFNQKGGVGKSTAAIDFVAGLAVSDPEGTYLFLDFDAQGHGTEGIGLKESYMRIDGACLYQGIMDLETIEVANLIEELPHEKFFAIPANVQMMVVEEELGGSARNAEGRLSDLLDELDEAFTGIVLDSPSYFGHFTDNILRAIGIPYKLRKKGDPTSKELLPKRPEHVHNGLVVPVQAEQTSVRALELLINQIQLVGTELKVEVNIWAILPNLVEAERLGKGILSDFRANLPELLTPFNIPKRVVIREAYSEGRSIFTFVPKTKEGRVDHAKMKDVIELRNLFTQLAELVKERSGLNDATRAGV